MLAHRDRLRRLSWVTISRLALVPPMVLTLDRWPAVTALLLVAFVAWDYLDGVIARGAEADNVARRITDTAVDRLSVYVLLVAGAALSLLPIALLALFALRELVAGVWLTRLLRESGVVIRADSLYRGFNLSIAAWGALAPLVSAPTRVVTFAFVLLLGCLVLRDIRRSCEVVSRRFVAAEGVVSAGRLREAHSRLPREGGSRLSSPVAGLLKRR